MFSSQIYQNEEVALFKFLPFRVCNNCCHCNFKVCIVISKMYKTFGVIQLTGSAILKWLCWCCSNGWCCKCKESGSCNDAFGVLSFQWMRRILNVLNINICLAYSPWKWLVKLRKYVMNIICKMHSYLLYYIYVSDFFKGY